MKNFLILPILTIVFVFTTSCSDDDKETFVDYDVTIAILEPEEDAVFATGEELHMEVDFDANKALGNYEVLALNLTSGDTIAHFTGTSTELFLAFHEHQEDLLVTAVSNCTLTASAWETNYADRISESVNFTINP